MPCAFLFIFGILMWMLRIYHKKFIWLGLFLACSVMILAVSLIPDSGRVIIQGAGDTRWDYLQHFAAYFAFGFIYVFWRADKQFSIRGIELASLFAVTIGFSILTEYAQLLIPGRAFNMIDALYNLSGVFIGILVGYVLIIRNFLKKKFAQDHFR